MKVLLVSPKSYYPPLGLAYISSAIKAAGHSVSCLPQVDPKDLKRKLAQEKPDVFAAGGLSINYSFFRDVIKVSHELGIKSILGGGVVTSEPEKILRAIQPTFSVLGEGEETVVELLACIAAGGNPESVKGIGFLKDGNYVETPSRPAIQDINLLPFPDWEGIGLTTYLDNMKPSDGIGWDLFDHPRHFPLITARSCPYNCTFCYHPIGQKYRQRSLDSVFKELEETILAFKINVIEIVDELFTVNEARVQDFCTRFQDLAKKFPWEIKWWCQIRVDKISSEMLSLMEKSGCVLICYGLESFSKTILDSMKKRITPEQIERAVKLTHSKKLSLQGNFIFGDRAETFETMRETLDFWVENKEIGIMLGIVLPLPDSELYRYCLKKGLIKNSLNFIERHFWDPINMTGLSDWDFARLLHHVKMARLKHCVRTTPVEIGDDFVTVKCPFCKEMITYGNYDLTFDNVDLFRIPASKKFFNKMMYCRKCRKRFYVSSKLFRLFSKLVQYFSTPLGHYFHLKRIQKDIQ